jgi:hypothetical protein
MVLLLAQKIGLTLCTQKQAVGQKKASQSLVNLFRPPHQHFQISGKMEQRLGIGKFYAGDLRHGIPVKLGFRILQLPWQVMNVCAQHMAFIDGIKAIALREKSFE